MGISLFEIANLRRKGMRLIRNPAVRQKVSERMAYLLTVNKKKGKAAMLAEMNEEERNSFGRLLG